MDERGAPRIHALMTAMVLGWRRSGEHHYFTAMSTNTQTSATVKPIPDGYHTVTPYLVVKGAAELIEFMKHAFGAEEIMRHATPEGGIMHAEVQIGDSRIMLGEACGEFRPMPAMIHLYVNDADAVYRAALGAGGTSLREPADQFYGDRSAGVKDAWGNQWWIATHKEDISPEEIKRRSEAARGSH
jgi:PhnB protein